MVRIGTLVLHVGDINRASRFWSEALGYTRQDDDGGSAVLTPEWGDSPPLTLDEQDATHLDLVTASRDEQQAEVERLVALGARRVPWQLPEGADHVVLADTEGNLFCVTIDPERG